MKNKIEYEDVKRYLESKITSERPHSDSQRLGFAMSMIEQLLSSRLETSWHRKYYRAEILKLKQ